MSESADELESFDGEYVAVRTVKQMLHEAVPMIGKPGEADDELQDVTPGVLDRLVADCRVADEIDHEEQPDSRPSPVHHLRRVRVDVRRVESRRDELAGILVRIHRALRPSGVFYASYKMGESDGRDSLGRYYNYASPEWLEATYASAGPWTTLSSEASVIQSFDQTPANMLNLVVRKA